MALWCGGDSRSRSACANVISICQQLCECVLLCDSCCWRHGLHSASGAVSSPAARTHCRCLARRAHAGFISQQAELFIRQLH
jgi:hypothetical protein